MNFVVIRLEEQTQIQFRLQSFFGFITIACLLLAAVAFVMTVYRSAMDAEDSYQAFSQAYNPTIMFVATNGGDWPRSWDDLASVEPANNYEWVAQHIDYDFNADPAELARLSPSTFDAIKTKRSSYKFENEIRLLLDLLRQHHPKP